MNMKSTLTCVIFGIGMIYMSADRRCLAYVRRIDILNFNTRKSGFVFYILRNPIERPVMQAAIVFALYSFRRADVC